ncbi:MAG: hypothetical protein OEQ39_04565 [Gammaproteobacteria bacterium]|nr:hypothetical protein [Gammaproteobacteria bacterium]MDH3465793.1 hypothetical protein [Gammaproteobacteria bacterium]
MRLSWLPWKLIIRSAAKAHGFLDPVALLSHIHKFAQPSEVAEPIELLRAGVVFHARGLINSRIIQHNLDWVWPYWVERQFDPTDDAFIPRAFTLTHINVTHRNWTAIGVPDCDHLPVVDPRGLLTPLWDKWSIDTWIVADAGPILLPSRNKSCDQRLDLGADYAVVTEAHLDDLVVHTRADVMSRKEEPVCRLRITGSASQPAWLVVAIRPYNPEGISFVHEVALSTHRNAWLIDNQYSVRFDHAADRHHLSDYRHGDVYIDLHDARDDTTGQCDVGMLTAAAMFRLPGDSSRELTITIPLEQKAPKHNTPTPASLWPEHLQGHCRLQHPDEHLVYLYDAAICSLILCTPGDVYPGPYTYKRFWFRDATFIVHALSCAGLAERAERILDTFPERQSANGYFHSQEGEWDANGEVLWVFNRFCQITGRPIKPQWWPSVNRGAKWIQRKRLTGDRESLHVGLLPAGFSAEHLGPNDYYYWDDFWGIAGLRAAATLASQHGDMRSETEFRRQADDFLQAVEQSLSRVAQKLKRRAMPASPYRRLDAGAIGSIVAGYPLQLFDARDSRLLDSIDFLLETCFLKGGFFQDMIHSGINPYLTLHVAQVLLRAGDPRYAELIDTVALLASPTGQWPEAIHPRTGGGCMGDGHHAWASAEWIMMMRNCFVREEGTRLILASGVSPRWLAAGKPILFGPAPTIHGPVTVTIEPARDNTRSITVAWQAVWHDTSPLLEIRTPGFVPAIAEHNQNSIKMYPAEDNP